MNNNITKIQYGINAWVVFFMIALVVSGITAIPVKQEINWLLNSGFITYPTIRDWLLVIQNDLNTTPDHVLYGFDWLAFAHIVIAIAFIGVLRNPVRNIWVIEFGMLACISILPFAFIMGEAREIPIWWRVIDCSFGVFGMIPLWIVWRKIKTLERLFSQENQYVFF